MDLHAVIAEVGSWPLADRLRLVEEIWDGLIDQDQGAELTEVAKAELDRRIEEMDQHPNAGVPWEVARDRVLARLQK